MNNNPIYILAKNKFSTQF